MLVGPIENIFFQIFICEGLSLAYLSVSHLSRESGESPQIELDLRREPPWAVTSLLHGYIYFPRG